MMMYDIQEFDETSSNQQGSFKRSWMTIDNR